VAKDIKRYAISVNNIFVDNTIFTECIKL